MELSQEELKTQYETWMTPTSTKLSEEENTILQTLIYLDDEEEFSFPRFHITKQQLQSLIPGSWIKSSIYDVWLDHLLFSLPNNMSSRTEHSLFKSIAQSIKQDGTIFNWNFEEETSPLEVASSFLQQLKRNTNSSKIYKIFVPVCAKNHGSLAVLYLKTKQVVHIDTLRHSARDLFILSTLSKWMQFLDQEPNWIDFIKNFFPSYDTQYFFHE